MRATFKLVLLLTTTVLACGSAGGQQAAPTDHGQLVVDPNGDPVAAAEVVAFKAPFDAVANKTLQVVARCTADRAGRFAFTEKVLAELPVMLVARHEAYAPGSVLIDTDGAPSTLRIALSPPTDLAGEVVDEAGQPLAGVRVSACVRRDVAGVQQDLPGHAAVPELLTTTDAHGRFRCTRIPGDGRVALILTAEGRANTAHPAGMRPVLTPGTVDLRIAMTPAAVVTGSVRHGRTGRPVAGATVVGLTDPQLPLPTPSARTDEQGRFRLEGLATGSVRISAHHAAPNRSLMLSQAAQIDVRAGRTTSDVTLRLQTTGTLQVTAVGRDGATPIQGAQVVIRSGDGRRWHARTNERGVALQPMPPGEHTVWSIQHKAYAGLSRPEEVRIRPGQTTATQWALDELAVISGVVRDEAGKPVKGARVRLLAHRHNPVCSDDRGRFRLRWSPNPWSSDDDALLVVRHPPSRTAATCTLSSQDPLRIDLKPGVVMTGAVLDAEGQPLAGAAVTVYMKTERCHGRIDQAEIQTGADGRFRVGALPAGQGYDVVVRAAGHAQHHWQSRGATGDRPVDLGAARLARTDQTIRGTVMDMQGDPVPNVNVLVRGSGSTQQHRQTVTDARARIQLTGLVDDYLTVVAVTSAEPTMYGQVCVKGGHDSVDVVVSGRPPSVRARSRSRSRSRAGRRRNWPRSALPMRPSNRC
ncbi:MAG: hypothetical protein GVY24_02930 [Planctomycetes bacterium]|nr:hypothetical protein [Planctomycetota bacterium]